MFGTRDDLIAKARTAGYTVYGENDLQGLGVMFALKSDPKEYNLPKPEYKASIMVWDSLIRPLSVIGLGAVAAGALLHYLTVGPKDVEHDETPKKGGE